MAETTGTREPAIAHHGLFVERPQVFQAAAAAGDDQHVDRPRQTIGRGDGGGNFGRGPFALHAGWQHQHVDAAPPPPEHFQKVAQRRPGRTGNDRDLAAGNGARAACVRPEQPFGGQPLAKLPQGQLQGPHPLGQYLLDHQLITAPRGVQIQMSLADHFQPVVQVEPHPGGGRAPQHGPQLGRLVLERQIAVPRLGTREIRNFAADPNGGESRLDDVLDFGRRLPDREHRLGAGRKE